LTVEDWHALPESDQRYELYEGMLIVVPAPDFVHQAIVGLIHTAFLDYGLDRGGFATAAPTGVALGQTIGFEPDVLYLSAERMRLIARRGVDGAPDLVVEVASPSTRRFDIGTKLPVYLRAGVREVWIVDPERRTVSVYGPDMPNAPETVPFGAAIPSKVVEVGSARLEKLPDVPDGEETA
jgi:Uma2 family endonuclease